MEGTSTESNRQNVIDALNTARSLELNAIVQYMNHHYNLANMDYGDMAMNIKLIAIDEMRHAELFAERIKELGGEPTVSPAGKPAKDGEVAFMFDSNTSLENSAIEAYNGFVQVCRASGDHASARLFEQIIDDEQAHFNYFDSVRDHIASLGDTFLARIAGTPSATGIVYQGFVDRLNAGGGGAA